MAAEPTPKWAKKKIDFKKMHKTEEKLRGLGLNTVCHNARCPNISECYDRGTATFLILGDICTRRCEFCNVEKGAPGDVSLAEPDMILKAVKRLDLKYVVITSVTRDDLEDGGASQYVACIRKIKEYDSSVKVEVLVPDFQGSGNAIETVVKAGPDVFAHNIETVESLYKIRRGGRYKKSLQVLGYAKKMGAKKTKSAIMLGLGEKFEEVIDVLIDLREVDCDYMAIGQYMQPDSEHIKVKEYVKEEMFEKYKAKALDLGFEHVESGTWVRSSYMADAYGLK